MQSVFDVLQVDRIRDICKYLDPCDRQIVAASSELSSRAVSNEYVSALTAVSCLAKRCDIRLLERMMRYVDPCDDLSNTSRMSIHDIFVNYPYDGAFEGMIADAAISILQNAPNGEDAMRLVGEFFDIQSVQSLPLTSGDPAFAHFYFARYVLVGFLLRHDTTGFDQFLDSIISECQYDDVYDIFVTFARCCTSENRAQYERMITHMVDRAMHDADLAEFLQQEMDRLCALFGIVFLRRVINSDVDLSNYVRCKQDKVFSDVGSCCPEFLEWMIATIPDLLTNDVVGTIIMDGSPLCAKMVSDYCCARGGISDLNGLSLRYFTYERTIIVLRTAAPGAAGDHLRALASAHIATPDRGSQYFNA